MVEPGVWARTGRVKLWEHRVFMLPIRWFVESRSCERTYSIPLCAIKHQSLVSFVFALPPLAREIHNA
jgi:hypothetical protein